MLTVYGRRNSSSVQLVMWTIHELGLNHQRLDYGHGYAPAHTEEFRAKNPMGRVPVIEDGSFCMFESAAILRYLSAEHGDDRFWPRDLRRRGTLDTWAEWGKNTFSEVVLDIFAYDVRLSPDHRDPAILANAVNTLRRLAAMLDARVAGGPWIGAEDFTFADIACGHILYRYFTLDWDRPNLMALAAYYKRLQERAAYRDHVMVSYESLRGSY